MGLCRSGPSTMFSTSFSRECRAKVIVISNKCERSPEPGETSPFGQYDKFNLLSSTLDSRFRGNDINFKFSAPPRLCG